MSKPWPNSGYLALKKAIQYGHDLAKRQIVQTMLVVGWTLSNTFLIDVKMSIDVTDYAAVQLSIQHRKLSKISCPCSVNNDSG